MSGGGGGGVLPKKRVSLGESQRVTYICQYTDIKNAKTYTQTNLHLH